MNSNGLCQSEPFSLVPFWLLAELTYACPLQCSYCSNPTNFSQYRQQELNTAEWIRVLEEGRALGAVQLGLSGGEPCVRRDLEEIIAAARGLGYYTNLLTSTVGMDEARLERLVKAGIDHIQVSFQGTNAHDNDLFAGTDSFQHKLRMAKAIRAAGVPMVLNFVLHRHNIHQVGLMLELARELDAEAVELANCQYQGWAWQNMHALLPSLIQLQDAEAEVKRFRERYGTALPVLFVVPDLYENRPRPCVNGWGSTMLSVTPNGRVLPCQGAHILPDFVIPNVREHGLAWIWEQSSIFNRFRGSDWLPEPCRSCSEQTQDHGGCRCQAYLITGDATATDPVCDKSPQHQQVVKMRESAVLLPVDEMMMRAPKPYAVKIPMLKV